MWASGSQTFVLNSGCAMDELHFFGRGFENGRHTRMWDCPPKTFSRSDVQRNTQRPSRKRQSVSQTVDHLSFYMVDKDNEAVIRMLIKRSQSQFETCVTNSLCRRVQKPGVLLWTRCISIQSCKKKSKLCIGTRRRGPRQNKARKNAHHKEEGYI